VVVVVPLGGTELVVVGGQVVVGATTAVVLGPGTPSGSFWLIWRPSAVIAPTTTSTTSATRIVYSRTDAPRSFFTAR